MSIASRAKAAGQSLDGSFRTAPAAGDAARVVFTVTTGHSYGSQDVADGYRIYGEMLRLDPTGGADPAACGCGCRDPGGGRAGRSEAV